MQAELGKEARDLQREMHGDERELRIVEQVLAALRTSRENPAQLQAASALVYRLPEQAPIRCQLAQILVNEELRAAGQSPSRFATSLRYECVSEEQAIAAARGDNADFESSSDAAARSGVGVTEDFVQAPNPRGWNVDVFACTGMRHEDNQRKARQVVEALAAAARANQQIASGLYIGRVRLRDLRDATNAMPSYGANADEIRAEASEAVQGRQLASFVGAQTGIRLGQVESGTATPFYLSVFICTQSGRQRVPSAVARD